MRYNLKNSDSSESESEPFQTNEDSDYSPNTHDNNIELTENEIDEVGPNVVTGHGIDY